WPAPARGQGTTRAVGKGHGRPRSTPTGPCPATWWRRRGTAPRRWRSVDCDLFWQQALGAQLLDRVVGVHDAHRPGRRSQNHRLRVRINVLVPDAFQQLARRDAGRGEENVVAGAEVVEAEHLVGLVP